MEHKGTNEEQLEQDLNSNADEETTEQESTTESEEQEVTEEVVEAEAVEEKSDEDIEILRAKVNGQKSRIKDLNEQLSVKNEDGEKLERLKHEFSNFKTRTFNERKQAKVSGKIKSINEFLDVIDNLERAMKFTSETEEFKVGLEMINKSLINKLEGLGHTLEDANDK